MSLVINWKTIISNTNNFCRKSNVITMQIKKFSRSKIKLSSDELKTDTQSKGIRAAILKKFSEPLVIENIKPLQISDPHEVLIDVHYCSLNGPDVLLTKNAYSVEPTLPKILGYEIAGKLLQVGDEAKAKGFKVGDKVIALNKNKFGGLAEQCVVEMNDVWKMSSSVKMLDSVCLLEDYLTALIGLEKKANLDEDEMVLINVGLGGIGLAAVDIAKNVFRAQVIGVSKSENRTALVRDKGAFASIKYNDKQLMNKIKEFADERGIKDVFDGEEGDKFKKMLECFTSLYKEENQNNLLRDNNFAVLVEHLSREGRLIVAGFAMTETDYPADKSQKCPFSITGIDLSQYKSQNLATYREAGNEILQYQEEGLIKPSYSLVAGLYKINEAVKFIADFKSTEKVVIDLKNPEAEMKFKEK
ncbi:quinone oxidoreductase-like protein 2 [Chelonus insularis]|uniref:quinone oxidoreductase-like protein 2 n=1 Tax=Chelonus insularis TaxID=460826 RepID=UPI00158F5288|nr:quinone oxidoreductase-like protein 2 [Chelonus insularis]